MTASLRRVSELLGAPLGVVLEGGYALDALARSVAATMEVMAAPAVPASAADTTSLSDAARRRVAEWWPALSG